MSRDQNPNGSGSSNRSLFANMRLEQDHPKNFRASDKRNGYDFQGSSNSQVPFTYSNMATESSAIDDEDYDLEEEQEEEYEDNQSSINQQQITQSDVINISDEEDGEQVNGSYHYNNNINNNNYEVRSQNIYQNVHSESGESNDCEIVSEYNDPSAQNIRDPRMTVLDIEIEEASRISTNGTLNIFHLNIKHSL